MKPNGCAERAEYLHDVEEVPQALQGGGRVGDVAGGQRQGDCHVGALVLRPLHQLQLQGAALFLLCFPVFLRIPALAILLYGVGLSDRVRVCTCCNPMSESVLWSKWAPAEWRQAHKSDTSTHAARLVRLHSKRLGAAAALRTWWPVDVAGEVLQLRTRAQKGALWAHDAHLR